MKTFFDAIGQHLGKTAAKARDIFDLVGGGDAEALAAEVRFGNDLAAAMLERVQLVEENGVTRFAAEIGHWLASRLKEKTLSFSFRVLVDTAPHAFALPGGHVFVSSSMLDQCQDQRDEIAFVLGHEMAHVVLRHAIDRMVRDSVLSLVLRRSVATMALGAWLKRAGMQTLSRAYSRESELAADSFAVSLIRTCGGDAAAGERFLEKLARRTTHPGGGVPGEYFATHPPLRERLAHLRSL